VFYSFELVHARAMNGLPRFLKEDFLGSVSTRKYENRIGVLGLRCG